MEKLIFIDATMREASRTRRIAAPIMEALGRRYEIRKIALDGTDFPAVHQCYEGGWEFACWLKSGMDPYRTLKAATSVNAGILRMDNIIGTIEPGKLADLAGWHRDVLTDPMALLQCDFVMKDGIVYPAVYNTQ